MVQWVIKPVEITEPELQSPGMLTPVSHSPSGGDDSEEELFLSLLELPLVCKPATSQGVHLSSEAEGLSEAHSYPSPWPVCVCV